MLAGVVVVGYLPHTTAVLWSPARRRSLLLPRHASASRQISGLCSSLSRLLHDARTCRALLIVGGSPVRAWAVTLVREF